MKLVTRMIGAVVLACGLVGLAHGKLPAPSEEQQAKAAEAKAKAADAAKRQGELLGKSQDRAVENFKRGKVQKTGGAGTVKK